MILLHYLPDSPYETPFWENAQKVAKTHMDTYKFDSNLIKIIELADSMSNTEALCNQHNVDYGTWGIDSFQQNLKGLGICANKY